MFAQLYKHCRKRISKSAAPLIIIVIIIIIIIIMKRFVARTYPPCWVLKARIQKHRGKPLLFHDKCPGFFDVHYTTHGTYSFTSHPKDGAIMVIKCLAQGHKRRDRPGWDLKPTFWQHQNLSPMAPDRSATPCEIIGVCCVSLK